LFQCRYYGGVNQVPPVGFRFEKNARHEKTRIPAAVATFANEGLSPQKGFRDHQGRSGRNGAFKIIDADIIDGANNICYSCQRQYMLYASRAGDGKSLAVVSVDGRLKQRLTTRAGNIKKPG
jgi:hypothetical protein